MMFSVSMLLSTSFSICIDAKADILDSPWVDRSQVFVLRRVENDRSDVAEDIGATRYI